MKTIIFIIVFINIAFCQTEPDLIGMLSSNDNEDVIYALRGIEGLRINEAIPVIVTEIENKIPYVQVEMLKTLQILDDKEFLSHANQFIDRAQGFGDQSLPFDPNNAKAIANILLFLEYGDEVYFNMPYTFFDQNPNDSNFPLYMRMLEFALNNTLLEAYCKDELVKIAETHTNKSYRFKALKLLHEKYASQIIDLLINIYLNDSYYNIRSLSLQYLSNYLEPEVHNLLLSNLNSENESALRYLITNSLLNKFASPTDYYEVIRHRDGEKDPITVKLLNYEIKHFIPPPFDPGFTVAEIGNIIDSHIVDIINYKWAPTDYEEYFDLIQQYLDDPSQYATAIEEIDNFLLKVESDYDNEIITPEAYKFLKDETEYLREKLEKE